MLSHAQRQSTAAARRLDLLRAEGDQWLCTKEVAAYTGFSASFFEKRRIYGGGPVFYRFYRKIRYKKQDVTLWLEARRYEPEGG
jgi:hypothetical protein